MYFMVFVEGCRNCEKPPIVTAKKFHFAYCNCEKFALLCGTPVCPSLLLLAIAAYEFIGSRLFRAMCEDVRESERRVSKELVLLETAWAGS